MSPMLMPARASARRDASIGPSPMISGERAETPVATTRASGVRPSWAALVSLMTTTAAAPSLSGQQLPAVTVPSGRNTGFRALTPSRVTPGRGTSSAVTTRPSGLGAGAGAVVGRDDASVGHRHGGDLALEEAVGDGLLGAVLAGDAPLVLALPR